MEVETRRSGTLGAGAYGSVHRGTWAGREVAVKRFLGSSASSWTQTALREVGCMASVPAHPFLMRLDMAYLDDRGKVHLVFPRLRETLYSHIKHALRGSVPPGDAWRWGAQLLQGVAHMHRHGYLHRDIKLENVLMDAGGNAVLGDFGMARFLPAAGSPAAMTGKVCSLWTRCPELCLPTNKQLAEYDERIDSWSVGCVLLSLAAGKYVIRGDEASGGCTLPCIFQLLGVPEGWEHLRAAAGTAALTREQQLDGLRAACRRNDLPPEYFESALDLLAVDPERRARVVDVAARAYWATEGGPMAAAAPPPMIEDATVVVPGAIADGAVRTVSASLRKHLALWMWDTLRMLRVSQSSFLDSLLCWMAFARTPAHDALGAGQEMVAAAACCSLVTKVNELAPMTPSAWSRSCGSSVRVKHVQDMEHFVLVALHGRVVGLHRHGLSPREVLAAAAALAVTEMAEEDAFAMARAVTAASLTPAQSVVWKRVCLDAGRIVQCVRVQ